MVLNLPEDTLLILNRPLYGIPEAGVQLFWTYLKHHRQKLDMKSAPHDICLLYTPGSTSKNEQKFFHPVDTAPSKDRRHCPTSE